ncbi:hypothetical protein MXB_5319 [Myxobolus squamalis]|nr:hypothetical protein MXB_5319 [Myxobolus squamalis]
MTAALTTSRVASELILDAIHEDTGLVDPVEAIQPEVSGIPMVPSDNTTILNSSGLCSFEFSEYTNCIERFPNDSEFCRNFLDIFKACQNKNQ